MSKELDLVKKSLIRKSTSEYSVLDYGKLPPQSKELEETVLGAVMIESGAMKQISSFMRPDMFYVDAHQRIARAIVMLHIAGDPIDLLTVTEQLKQNGELDAAGGPFYVAQLTNKVGSAANVEVHVRFVFEKYIQRMLICFGTEIIKDSYEDTSDAFETFDKAEKLLRELKVLFHTGSLSTTSTVLEKADEQSLSGFVKSKHAFINRAFNGGWQKGTLNIVAARPAMGKSAWYVSDMIHVVDSNANVAAFNLEMMERQLITRIICNRSRVPNSRYSRNKLYDGEDIGIADARKWIVQHDYNLTLDFTPGITVYDLIAKMQKIKIEKGLDIAYIDHLQFITLPAAEAKGQTKDQQIGVITRALKGYAKENDVALVVLCHLSRETERGTSKRPGLAHLRESGNIENDADTVSFLFRPEYYFEKDANGIPQYNGPDEEQYRDICKWLNDKNRDGHTFESEMKCTLGISNFEDTIVEPTLPATPSHPVSSQDGKDNDTPF